MAKEIRVGFALMLAVLGSEAVTAEEIISRFDFNASVNAVGTSIKQTTDEGVVYEHGGQSAITNISLGYTQPVGPRFTIGFRVGLDLNDVKGIGISQAPSYQFVSTLKDLKSFSIEPGIKIGDATLVYLSVARWTGQTTTSFSDGEIQFVATGEANFRAIGFGVGARTQLTSHIYLCLEADRIQFSKESVNVVSNFPGEELRLVTQPEQTRASLKLGLSF
jgi:hypothetical protein